MALPCAGQRQVFLEMALPCARPLRFLFETALPCPRLLRFLVDMALPCARPLRFLVDMALPCARPLRFLDDMALPCARLLRFLDDMAVPCARLLRFLFDMALPRPRPLLFLFDMAAPSARQPKGEEASTLVSPKEDRMTTSLYRVRAALNRPTRESALVAWASRIVQAMSRSSWFKKPMPPLSKVQAAIDKFQKALVVAAAYQTKFAAAKNAAKKKLFQTMEDVKRYVQSVADANPAHAADIIESAGLSVVERQLPAKPILAVKKGRVSGTVVLVLKAVGKDAFYEFQRSDDGKKSWIDLPIQKQTTKEVQGLVPGKTYWFRARGTTRRVGALWCDPVAYVVQ